MALDRAIAAIVTVPPRSSLRYPKRLTRGDRFMDMGCRLILENSVFVMLATGFLSITGWAWRHVRPFELPKPLPGWFKLWFGSVQFLGIVPPLAALIWGFWQGDRALWSVLVAYFVLLAIQVLSEWLTLRQLHSVVWVMVPYLYVPYRLWQLWEGWAIVSTPSPPNWLEFLFMGEIVVWGINYLLDLAQLPRLLRWPGAAPQD